MTFRDRCKALVSKLSMDGMLRQNDPVQTVMEFVQSEMGRSADHSLEETKSLILYFGSEEDRAEFKTLIHQVKPGMIAREIP